MEQPLEQTFQIVVVRAVFKTQRTTVLKVTGKFGGVSLADFFHSNRHFAVQNSIKYVVPTALLNAILVSIDGSETSRPREAHVLKRRDVLVRIAVLLGPSEIDDMDDVFTLSETDHNVFRFHITVYERL